MTIKEMEELLSQQNSWYFERYKNYGKEKYNHNVLISNNYPNHRIVAQNKTRTKWKIISHTPTNQVITVTDNLTLEEALILMWSLPMKK